MVGKELIRVRCIINNDRPHTIDEVADEKQCTLPSTHHMIVSSLFCVHMHSIRMAKLVKSGI